MKPFLLMGAGKVLIDVLTDTGAPTGLALKGNCTKVSVKPDSELIEEYGASDEDLFQVIGSVTIPKPAQAEAEFNQVDADLFAMAFMGTNSLFTQTLGTVADPGQEFTVVLDKAAELGKYGITVTSVKSGDGTTTYLEGVDYIVRPRIGGIIPLSTGSMVAGAKVKAVYSWPAIEGSVMRGMTKSNVRCRIVWEGKNYADGREFILELHQARLAPSADFNFQNAIEKQFLRVAFNMSLETPVGRDEPFKLTWLS